MEILTDKRGEGEGLEEIVRKNVERPRALQFALSGQVKGGGSIIGDKMAGHRGPRLACFLDWPEATML